MVESGVEKILDCMSKKNGRKDKKEKGKKADKKPKDPKARRRRRFSLDLPDLDGIDGPDFDGIDGPDLDGIDGPDLGGIDGIDGPDFDGIDGPGGTDAPDFKWPGINDPGFPTLVAGCLGASLAGLGVLKDFIPIKFNDNGTPKIPDLPGIDIFVKGFTGAASGLPSIKGTSIPVPGVGSIPLPDIQGFDIPDGSSKRLNGTSISFPGFDPSSMLKMIGLFIGAPFLIIKGIIESIPSLNIGIPDIPGIFFKAGDDMGIPKESLNLCIPCLAKSILEIIKIVLPI